MKPYPLCAGEQCFTTLSAHAGVPAAKGDGAVGRSSGRVNGICSGLRTCHHALAERQLVAGRCPIASVAKLLRYLQNQLFGVAAVVINRPIDFE